MKLLKRLKRIWKLGEEPTKTYGIDFGHTTGTIYPNNTVEFKGDRMAKVISMKPIEEDIEKLLQETNQEKNGDTQN